MLKLKAAVLVLVAGAAISGGARAQSVSPSPVPAARDLSLGWLWIERFDASSDADGRIFAITSSTGYNFNHHFGVDVGIPIYIVNAAGTSTSPATSASGLGDAFVGLRFAIDTHAFDYRSTLSGTAPTGSSSKGLSTGHATFDWSNRFEKKIGRYLPFGEVGIGNSLSQRMLFLRPFSTYGYLAHFEGGTEIEIVGPLSITASAYDIAPWGTQTLFSRVAGHGNGGHGRAFETSQQTSGGSNLTRDEGFNLFADVAVVGRFDVYAGYTRSIHYALNNVSFGIGVNVKTLLRGKGK
jgi:hypothetical protein